MSFFFTNYIRKIKYLFFWETLFVLPRLVFKKSLRKIKIFYEQIMTTLFLWYECSIWGTRYLNIRITLHFLKKNTLRDLITFYNWILVIICDPFFDLAFLRQIIIIRLIIKYIISIKSLWLIFKKPIIRKSCFILFLGR